MATLMLLTDKGVGQVFPLQEELTIGRDWSNDIQVLDGKVSRAHARLQRAAAGGYCVQDLRSHNGTYVNDERISERPLNDGDRLQVGDTGFIYQADERDLLLDTQPNLAAVGATAAADPDEDENRITFSLRGDLQAEFLQQTDAQGNKAKLERAQRDLTALFEISNLLNTERDRDALFEKICERIAAVLRAEVIYVMEMQPGPEGSVPVTRTVRLRNGPGERGDQEEAISQMIVRRVTKDGQSVLVHDAIADGRFKQSASVVINRLRSVMCVPIRGHEGVLGVIYLSNQAEAGVFTRYDLQLLTAIGIEAGIALENRLLFEDLESLFLSTIGALAATIDLRDMYTHGHSQRVAGNAATVAKELQLAEDFCKEIRIGGILHDIGKIGIADKVLRLPGQFNAEQRRDMQRHPEIGANILANIPRMKHVAEMVRHHHEQYGGDGYPDGVAGERIPLAARIIAVCDTFDAITSNRVYRRGRSAAEAAQELSLAAGTQLDPVPVEAFLRALRDDRIHIPADENP